MADTEATKQAKEQPADLLDRALELQRAGREEEAAELYATVIAHDPRNPNAHNMLAVILAEQWKMPEAMHHAHLAGELTGWKDPFFYRNYIALMKKVLGNADNARTRQAYAHYREELDTSLGQSGFFPRISVLLFEPASPAELGHCLKNLAKQHPKPHEVLIAADSSSGQPLPAAWPFAVRLIETSASSLAERINFLAREAHGDFILALRKGDTLLPGHLAGLVKAAGSSERWAFVPLTPMKISTAFPVEDPPMAGFLLLTKDDRVVTESNLLVPLALHHRIGGYDPCSAAPLQDYCLRLLWEAEPTLARNETCMLGAEALESCADRLAEIGRFFDKAFSKAMSPNPFAPTKGNWGYRLHLHVAMQELFVSLPSMAAMNREVEDYLAQKQQQPIQTGPGVNLVGWTRGEFGLAENMRAFARASLRAGIPCAIRDVNLDVGTRQDDATLHGHFAEKAHHNCTIFFVNPDVVQLYKGSLDGVVFERPSVNFRHYKIGYWFWEMEKIPEQWSYAFDKIDEIWVSTEFIAAAMRRATNKPVIKIPTPIAFEVAGRYDREYFGLPSSPFLFLFSFDFNSFPERKNPYAVIRAFQRAFPRRRHEVGLVIKSVNGFKRPQAVRDLLEQVGNDPRIILKNDFMSRDEIYGLQSVIDAYVSLHRSEGLGLGLAECMYQGKPVIGTAYSGNLEFMNEANSGLVNYSLVPIRKGEYLYDDPGFFWAEPDEEHAACLMARLVDDTAYRNRIAGQGREDIMRGFNCMITAERMRSRLLDVGAL